jgi:competence protein ComEA
MSPRLMGLTMTVWLALALPATAGVDGVAAEPARATAESTVDLNHADVDALCTLPGIGRKKAEAIIALRERRPFTRVTQLLQIKGIGHKTLLKLKPRVTVTAPTPKAPPAPPTVAPPATRVLAARHGQGP